MDPLEPARNDENSGISRRSISSILKVPRKSIRYPEPEQQENLVECPKPVEKRNSRRVSFAPADNVLIFSNEVKNGSPGRRPLQDLITTTTTQNRVEIAEDEIQQITGMETLLNAPLHAPHKRDKVNFHTEDAFGEKTVMFSADDAFMDMTHCQTINIANNAELLTDTSLRCNDVFPTKEINVLFDADNGAMGVFSKNTAPLPTSRSTGPNSDITSISSTVSSPGFKNFLADLFKSNDPHSKTTEVTVAGRSSEETQQAEVDEENQAPQSVRAVMEGSLNASRKMDTPLYGSLMTKSIEALPDNVSSSFPSKEFFPRFDCTSQLKQQQSSGNTTSFLTKEKIMLKTPYQRDMGTLDRTIMFSAGDEFMDMTQSHTVNIASGSLAHMSQKQTIDNCKSQKEQQHDTHVLGASVSGMDQGFNDFFAGHFKTKSKVPGHEIRFDAEDDRRDKTVRFSADDACMDVTQSHTVNIATHNLYAENGHLQKEETGLPKYKVMETSMTASLKMGMKETEGKFDARDKTVMVTAEESFMDVTKSHTVNIASDLGSHSQQNTDFLPGFGEKTIRFSVNEATMDVTQSHTVNIVCDLDFHSQLHEQRAPPGREIVKSPACDVAMDETQSYTANIDTGFNLQPSQKVDFIPMIGEKIVRFTENDAAMDVMQSHTVNMASDLEAHPRQNDDGLPPSGEKTVRFTDCDAAIDVTKSHTVNIASDLNFYSQQSLPCAASGEETLRFVAGDAAMDETQSHTVNIDVGLNLRSHQNLDRFPAFGEKTIQFSAKEADMDVTRSHTVDIASDLDVHPEPKHAASPSQETKLTANDTPMDVAQSCTVNIDMTSGTDSAVSHRDSDMIFSEEPMGFPLSLKKREDETCPAPFLFKDTEDTQGFLDQLGPQKLCVDIEKKSPVNQAVLDCPAVGLDVAVTEAQTDHNLRADEPPQCVSVSSCETKSTCEEMTIHKDVFAAHLTGDKKECEPRKSISQKCDDDIDVAPSRKSKRMSFADLHTKIRRLSHMISAAPDSVATESCTAALLQQEQDVDRNAQEKVGPSPAVGPTLGPAVGTNEEAKQDQSDVEPTTTATETPFKLKTKQLMSRLSMGGFKPRLPQRAKASDGMATSAGEQTKKLTANVTSQLRDFDADVSDINNEELDSCEDISEVLGNKSPRKAGVKLSPPEDFNMDRPLEDAVLEDDLIPAAHGQKRLLPTDEDDVEDERRQKTEAGFNTGSQSCLGDYNSDITSAPTMTTQTTDESSSSHTASIRCEATFESTFKQSLFESHLEDYASDMQRKLDDGTVTMLEFFKLFNIDFVIHNPRQSILPERLLSETERTPLDSLKDRHIHHPKHKMYEINVLNLTEKVEGLKERMHDLDKPLKIINKTLWEELSGYTENELRSFGTKLKERNSFFRKTSKVWSHEMKEELYSDLVQANQAEQQSLRATVEKADEMIRSLDGCICELEAELAQVVEKGSEDSPGLKSLQQEMNKVTEALADDDRQISELEVQMTENSKKLKRLKAETENLENHITTMHMLSEWRFGEASDSCTVYTFLYDTFHLQLTYQDSNGKVSDKEQEKKISHIAFHHHIDEKSQDYAHMVHRLLSQYTQGEPDWVKKYPTDRHVPKLLLDVSLVVGRCRLLGEELRLLKMWGGLRLDILNISCVDTLVHTVFSSVKNLKKFEVIFSVSLSDRHYVLHVHNFKNMIGDTTLQQVEEIVASLTPGKNLLTKTLKKIYETLPH